jgi:hypothetical protein
MPFPRPARPAPPAAAPAACGPRWASVRRLLAGLALAAGALAHAPALAQGGDASIDVQVTDGGTGAPLRGATVRLDGVMRAVSDTLGRVFLSGLEPGRHQLDVVMVGRRAVSPEIEIAGGEVLSLEVVLDEEAVVLPPVEASAGRDTNAAARAVRYRGVGRYIGRDDIARSRVRRLSELLVQLGVLQPNGRLRQTSCVPRLVADGLVLGETSIDIFPVQDLEAVQVFTSDVPPEFAGGSAGVCGVIALWTRHK